MQPFSLLLSLSLFSFVRAIPQWDYIVKDSSVHTFTGLSSTINMHYGNTTGLFMATLIFFESGDTGYFGIQPGEHGGMILYSVFGSDIYSDLEFCLQGADTGPGISCHQPFNWTENRNYTLSTTFVGTWANGSTVWQGWCRDEVTGENFNIGKYSVPKKFGLLTGQAIQWLEQFDHRSQVLEKPLVCTPQAGYSIWYPTFYNYGASYPTQENGYTAASIFDYCEKQQGKSGTVVEAIPGEDGWNVEEGTLTPLYPVN